MTRARNYHYWIFNIFHFKNICCLFVVYDLGTNCYHQDIGDIYDTLQTRHKGLSKLYINNDKFTIIYTGVGSLNEILGTLIKFKEDLHNM